MRCLFSRWLSLLLVFPLIFAGCSSTPKKNISTAEEGFDSSRESAEEVAIGEKIHAHILSSFYAYTDPRMVEYVNKVGNSLAVHAERQDLPYRFTLLYNDKIYATSAPGGFIYVTTGMVNFLDNEAELAAVIAHEIGELQYRDPRLSRSRRILDEITKVGTSVGPAFGTFGALAVVGLMMVNLAVTAQDKGPEDRFFESDRLALQYLVAAGYDPQGLIDFLYKFLKADEDVMPYFFDYYQSRPITNERFQSLQKEFSELPLDGKTLSTHRDVYVETTKGVREIYRA